jgi:hypothetical protein
MLPFRARFSLGIEGSQALKEGINDPALRLACNDGRVKRLGLRPIDEDQVSPSLRWPATGDRHEK